jgi:precorrin-2 methylase
MDDRSLASYLVRVSTDPAFRRLASSDAETSFADYDLTDEERGILLGDPAGMFGLLGRVVREQLGVTAPNEGARTPLRADAPDVAADRGAAPQFPSPPLPGTPLPEMAVLVRLLPYAEGAAGVDLRVSYVASMQPVPHPALVDGVPLSAAAPHEAPFDDAAARAGDDSADITIVGLGLVAPDHLTREAERAVREAREVLYLDTGIATNAVLSAISDNVTSLFAESYQEDGPRLDAYAHMAERVVEAAADHAPVVFAVHGHPLVGVHAPFAIARIAAERGLTVRVVPGISAMDCLFADLGIDPVVSGMQMYEATDLLLRRRPLQPDVPALIWQVGNLESRLHTSRRSRPERFFGFRDHLFQFYPRDHVVTIYFAAPHPLVPTVKIPSTIAELPERAGDLHAGVTVYVPPAFDRPVVDSELLARVDDASHLEQITD